MENPRVYFGQSALKPGRNLITLRVFKLKPEGGFLGKPEELHLTLGDGTAIPLAGEWKGKVAVDARPPHPLPIGYENLPTMPGVPQNGMLAPLAPLAITGAIWYQGESNVEVAYQYRKLLAALISDWRKFFGQGDFPFYVIGLPAFTQRSDMPIDHTWAEIRESQAVTGQKVPHTCLATTVDTGRPGQRPSDRQERGGRPGRVVRACRTLRCESPVFRSDLVLGGTASRCAETSL